MITEEKIKEVVNLLEPVKSMKEKIFEEIFPQIQDVENFLLIIPENEEYEKISLLTRFPWCFSDKYADKIHIINKKKIFINV